MGSRKLSLEWLRDALYGFIRSAERNGVAAADVPVEIKEDGWRRFALDGASLCFCGKRGLYAGMDFCASDEIREVAPDSRPRIGAEYWESRGPSSLDCSGFVKPKPAGERLLRLVKWVLETDEPKSRLDCREREPLWIQFKFSADEFDVERLDGLSREAGGVVDERILRECAKPIRKS